MKTIDQGPFGHWHEQYSEPKEVLYGGGHHVGKTEAARALRNQFALETAAYRIQTIFNLPNSYQGHIQHILRDFQDAITLRTEEVFLTLALKVQR